MSSKFEAMKILSRDDEASQNMKMVLTLSASAPGERADYFNSR